MDIRYYNRYTNKVEVEKVYGDGAVRFLYSNPIGKLLSGAVTSSIVSTFYGELQSMTFTKNKIPKFVKDFENTYFKNVYDILSKRFKLGRFKTWYYF